MPDEQLTKTQKDYLAVINERGKLPQGFKGLKSTKVVNALSEKGLIDLYVDADSGQWTAIRKPE